MALTGCTTGGAGPWAFGSVALLLAAGGGFGVGWLLAGQRRARELHDARQRARLAADLAGGLAWQTDAGHRLQPGALAADGQPLWDAVDAGAATDALRQAMGRQAPIDAVPVGRPGADGLWLLQAAPRFDAAGGFEGYQGVLRRADAGGPAQAALQALADASSGVLLVAVAGPESGVWQVLQASAAARQAFGDAPQLAGEQIQAALPAALRAAWAAGTAEAEAEGWQLRRLGAPPQPLCLIWQQGAEPGPALEQAAISYTVSHDLRAPIRVVEGFTRIVKEDYGSTLDRVANDHLDRVLGAVARMNQMIDAMLALARLSTQPLTRQPVNLSQLAGYVIDDLRRAAPERQVEVEIDPALQVHGDPTLLRLVLENLLGNAWKYSSRRPHAKIAFGREKVDGRTAFVVRDNGAGFDMRSAERLFGLFQRLHSANDFPGTGVGLASVRRIVQRHGGEIWAEGEVGRGAAFHFTLRD